MDNSLLHSYKWKLNSWLWLSGPAVGYLMFADVGVVGISPALLCIADWAKQTSHNTNPQW